MYSNKVLKLNKLDVFTIAAYQGLTDAKIAIYNSL